jgi:hypothetical protein
MTESSQLEVSLPTSTLTDDNTWVCKSVLGRVGPDSTCLQRSYTNEMVSALCQGSTLLWIPQGGYAMQALHQVPRHRNQDAIGKIATRPVDTLRPT